MLNQKNSKDTPSTISSQESADGHLQLDLLESVSQNESSQEAHLASHSAQPDKAAVTATSDTSHLTGSGWSQPSGLLGCLASKLQPQSEKTTGSMIYSMHWKQKATPRGRPYFQLVASAHRISDSDSGLRHGWPTPTASDNKDRGKWDDPAIQRRKLLGKSVELSMMVGVAGWSTPAHQDPGINPARLETKQGEAWIGSNRAYDSETGRLAQTGLTQQVPASLTGWPTPNAGDAKAGTNQKGQQKRLGKSAAISQPIRLKPDGTMLTGSGAEMESGGQLNPAHSRWLMGYPAEWDAYAPTEMPSSRKSRQK